MDEVKFGEGVVLEGWRIDGIRREGASGDTGRMFRKEEVGE